MPKPKIAMIGAGSLIFCKTLTMDILATPALQDCAIVHGVGPSRSRDRLPQAQQGAGASASQGNHPAAARLAGGTVLTLQAPVPDLHGPVSVSRRKGAVGDQHHGEPPLCIQISE